MEGFSVGAIASAVLKNIASHGVKSLGISIGKNAISWKKREEKLENYLRELTDFISYFVTYRYAPQTITEAFVMPNVISAELKLSYFESIELLNIFKSNY